ncbi:metallophosphoesterase family protein [Sphingomonas abaci]|uniref:Serine/threonine protein phosphatase 1 n=1 Tax=Sphingomonas abaci TaxID=237611 RepID=A0A7W7AID5_9SPHN|nr:metallophosphoesterase family protein [Sphingomonas abaci]MBB4616785.1 serine/threonine protein phosphatase 1 [Sphingomonas abaci]
MFRKFLNARRSSAPSFALPPGERVYAIGDVHGCLSLVDTILAAIAADRAARAPANTTLIFLGDLVDRGPESAAVLERLRSFDQPEVRLRILKGNHEEIFLKALDGDDKALRLFCRIGGRETIESYGMSEEEYNRLDYAELLAAMQRLVPAAHRDFVDGFEDSIAIGDYLFVHAGVRPEVALDAQRPADLRWIRDPFLDHPRPLEKMIVHGHTVTDAPEMRAHRIGIDTGAYQSGVLTAIGLEEGERWLLDTR